MRKSNKPGETNRLGEWRRRAAHATDRLRKARAAASERVSSGLNGTSSLAGEVYTAALNWKNNGEFSTWLVDHLSTQRATIASKAMDAEYLRTNLGGTWHRLYDGGHTVAGSWKAVSEALPDLAMLEKFGT